MAKKKSAQKKTAKPAQSAAELVRLKRQLFISERLRFESLRDPASSRADPSLLAAGVAHEFNNILGAADGHAEWALDSGKPADMREALEIVRQACFRSSQVTRALQGLAQPREEGREVFDVAKLFSELAQLFSARAKLDQVVFEVRPLNTLTYGNFGRLLEVLVNLVKNAFEALTESRGQVTVSGVEAEGRLLIEVSNTGAGIPAALSDKIFLPFFTTKGVLKRVSPAADTLTSASSAQLIAGSGLGLFLSRTIVEEHGGTLDLMPSTSGTRFQVSLPRVER